MSKITIQGNVTHSHIGDNIYHSYSSYLTNSPDQFSTETERELVKLIFDNTSSEEERKQILDSLKNISEGKNTIEEGSQFMDKLKSFGLNVTAGVVGNALYQYLKSRNLIPPGF